MPRFVSRAIALFRRAATEFFDDDCATMAAALAYYTAFALPPFLVLVVTIAGMIWEPAAVSGQLEHHLRGILGDGGWMQVKTMMAAAGKSGKGPWAAVMGGVGLLVGATGVMIQLQAALNRAWDVKPREGSGGIQQFIVKRLLSLAMILTVAFLLIVSLVMTSILQSAGDVIFSSVSADIVNGVPQAVGFIVNVTVFTLLFAAMFKWLPDVPTRWRDTWVGAVLTSLLFMAGKFALASYFSWSDTTQYGPAASFVLLLLWVYYSAMIFLFGAELTQVWGTAATDQQEPR